MNLLSASRPSTNHSASKASRRSLGWFIYRMLRTDFLFLCPTDSVIFPSNRIRCRPQTDICSSILFVCAYKSETMVIQKFRTAFPDPTHILTCFRKVGKITIYSSTVSTTTSPQVYQFVNRLLTNLAPIALIHMVTALIQSSVTELYDNPASRT